jgi:sporulation protein YunB
MWFRRRLVRPGFPLFRASRSGLFFLAGAVLLAILFQVLWMIEKHLHPMLVVIAKTEVKKIAQEAMLAGVRDVERSLAGELGQVMTVEKGSDGRITFVKIDPRIQAKIYEQMTGRLMERMDHLDQHEIGITVGQILQSNIFSDYGPDIPIQLWPKGAPKVNLEPEMKAQGINMVMVTLNLRVHAEMGMIVPFSEESFPVDFEYPIAQAVVVGEVPEYYFYNDLGQIKQEKIGTPHHPVPGLPQKKSGH